uniref:Uncharacterized protein n=1 Tax=Ananas comosus var. bracteatus TaxID=296719 RepID=A0A6V7PG48_ANACO|nr:unnamed protein product [Ananas comosus var. bracteatus]
MPWVGCFGKQQEKEVKKSFMESICSSSVFVLDKTVNRSPSSQGHRNDGLERAKRGKGGKRNFALKAESGFGGGDDSGNHGDNDGDGLGGHGDGEVLGGDGGCSGGGDNSGHGLGSGHGATASAAATVEVARTKRGVGELIN